MNELVPFEFESHTVRVVMIDDEPWFVANDLAAVLGYRDAYNMTRNLRPRQRGTHTVSTPSADQTMLIISEGGMYRAVLRSKKPEAERFQDFVEEELLPTLRRTGRYVLHDKVQPPAIMDRDPAQVRSAIDVVREARRLFGQTAARALWVQVGLPAPIARSIGAPQDEVMAEALRDWLHGRSSCTALEAARGIGIAAPERADTMQVGAILRMFGWQPKKVREGRRTENRWFRPASFEGGAA